MQAYRARYERGQVITLDNPTIPEGSSLIVTVLDALPDDNNQQDKSRLQTEAMLHFRESIRNCDEPVPEFERLRLREIEP